ncbi:MAG: discoidin domain-containing protein [Clostridia bacterium]|nr:discoidin domain-containing protein [Clostridia bacterium]
MTTPEKKKKLYTVANAHLDTQWNWTIQDTIRDCVKSTLEKNFALFEKYPHYRMNFEGAFRYKLAKEYYPDLYERLKGYIAEGRWNVAGSTWDAMDANVPSSEALMRQVLYGNGFFEKEFGKKSTDIFLADCFGFNYALPSVEAHMGLNGFHTQKLVWGVGSPIYEEDGTVSKPMPVRGKPRMDLGRWVGPDGNGVAASFLEGDYTYNFDRDNDERPVGQREEYLKAIDRNEQFTGHAVRSMYYGTGDYGGSCKEISAKMVNDAVLANGNPDALYEVISASTDQIFNELTEEERAALPTYDGELLIPHGSGALTSHTINKRWNRKNELLGDSAERAAIIAGWLGASEYPAERLLTAWQTFLWHQFHDDLPGTSIAAAYVFSYNDYVIALNMFAAELENAVGGIVRTLDTNVEGTPVVVYNPVSCERNDIVSAELDIKAPFVRVFDGLGNEVPAQISVVNGKKLVKFLAKVAPVSCTVYDVRESDVPCALASNISVNGKVLENQRYIVTIDDNGDIASVIDKANDNMELFKAPAQLEIGPDTSANWPSWELVWTDSLETPAIVGGTPEIEIVENGPAVVSLKVKRTFEGSTFEQIISLWDGGQRVDVANTVEWYQRKSNLRAAFHMNVSNPKATFDLGLGAIESGNTDSFPYYQHVAHQWADLTAEDGSYGISILNDCKYGMDKPNNDTLRLTLIHTPAFPFSQESGQDWQDMGLNIFTYSIVGHKGFRDDTAKEAAELNQPMVPFTAPKHDGTGKAISFVSVNDEHVIIRCVKKEEKGGRIIVRVQETSGKGAENVRIKFVSDIVSAVETNGYEDEIGAACFSGDEITCTLTPYAVKTFALTLACGKKADLAAQAPVVLPYNKRVTTCNCDRTAGEFAEGISIPSELYNEVVVSGGVKFQLAPANEENAVVCAGQTLTVPSGCDRLYLLAASANGDKTVTVRIAGSDDVDGKPVELGVQDYKANVGSWTMMVNGAPCLIKRDEIAVNYTHTHNAEGDRLYLFAYLFKYTLDVTGAKTVTLPEDSDILVMAATAGTAANDLTVPAAPLYDKVETPDAEKRTITVYDQNGEVVETLSEYEGKVALVRTSSYKDGYIFKGWESDDIAATYDNAAIVRVPDHDVIVKINAEKLGDDVLMNKPCKVSAEFNARETGANAINGDDTSKWCAHSEDGTNWLEVDAGEIVKAGKWMTIHAGEQESVDWNTRDFRLEYKVNEADEWTVADEVTDNKDTIVVREIAPIEARYFRFFVTKATQDDDSTVRLYAFQVYRA